MENYSPKFSKEDFVFDDDLVDIANEINEICPPDTDLSTIEEILLQETKKCILLENEITNYFDSFDNYHSEEKSIDLCVQELDEVAVKLQSLIDGCENDFLFKNQVTDEMFQLQVTKKNLSNTITVLNYLEIIVEGNKKLEVGLLEEDPKLISDNIEGLEPIANILSPYREVEQIEAILSKYQELKNELCSQSIKLVNTFISAYFDYGELDSTANLYYYWFKIIEFLGPEKIAETCHHFAECLIKNYQSEFVASDQKSNLDNIDRRFIWMKRKLMSFDQLFNSIIPMNWNLDFILIKEFYNSTENFLVESLQENKVKIDSKLMLYMIQKIKTFNEYVLIRFKNTENNEQTDERNSILSLNSEPAYMCKAELNPTVIMTEKLLNVFNPYFSVYANDQKNALDKLFSKLHQEIKSKQGPLYLFYYLSSSETGDHPEQRNTATVFPNAGELFLFYKHIFMQSCHISKGKFLYEIVELFKIFIEKYFKEILVAYPRQIMKKNVFLTKKSNNNDSDVMKVSQELFTLASTIICVEYCIDTITQLEIKIKSVIEHEWIHKINMKHLIDMYTRYYEKLIDEKLVDDLLKIFESKYSQMTKIDWLNINNVGDHSPYVNSIANELNQYIPKIRQLFETSKKHFIRFSTTFTKKLIEMYQNTLFKCHPVSQFGIEQLLLDLYLLKTIFLTIPVAGLQGKYMKLANQGFAEMVQDKISEMELDLKMISSPHENLEDFVLRFFSIIKIANIERFKRIIQMKDIKNEVQNKLLNCYNEMSKKFEMNKQISKDEKKRFYADSYENIKSIDYIIDRLNKFLN